MSLDSYKTISNIIINDKKYVYFDLNTLFNQFNINSKKVPFVTKILLENLVRNEDGISITSKQIRNFCSKIFSKNKSIEISFYPTRVLMQDFTGVPALADIAAMREAVKKKNINPNVINPLSRVDLVVDHSVAVDSYASSNSYIQNTRNEFLRNKERYEFLKWGQNSLKNFYLVPPGSGICHQVNLENISKTIWQKKIKNKNYIFPDSLVGTDSHTTMVNALSVLGWGVGGIEAEASMLGEPISLKFPTVVGFNLKGHLSEGVTATDLVLNITERLRNHGVVGKFVEFTGTGLKNLKLADRATISNMAPEYGATCGYFPTDKETINYLKLSGKNKIHLDMVKSYTKIQKLWFNDKYNINYDELINFNLNSIKPSVAGPKRPQDKIILEDVPNSFKKILKDSKKIRKSTKELISGDIVIAAITSCTNTSNPSVMIAAGLLAKKAVKLGLNVKPWVKTSLAPGSKVVSDYLDKSGLSFYLDKIGFNLVGYGCTTCIGNSGPLKVSISKQIKNKKLTVCSVLSGNRNFEGRIHQEVKANYLASPPLVVAYSLAGNIKINLIKDALGKGKNNKKIFLKDIWPSSNEIEKITKESISKKMFLSRYKEIHKGDKNWNKIQTSKQNTFKWNISSSYIKPPPFFDEENLYEKGDILNARILIKLGDTVTTDHISPAGLIKENSPAGKYLSEMQINKDNYNSYGSRRGNHEIMIRGTFANIRLRNQLVPNIEGGITKSFISNKKLTIFDAAMEYAESNIPLVIIAGKEYGTGSSRDWAAKGTRLLGVRAVIAESFERIHRSNLIGMGVLPLEFLEGCSAKTYQIKGDEEISIININKISPNVYLDCKISSNKKNKKIKLLCRIDTSREMEYYKSGGILQYVVNSIIKKAS